MNSAMVGVPGLIDGTPVVFDMVQVDTEWMTIPEGREPDPTWQFVDAAGHGHFAQATSTGGVEYPTLVGRESAPYKCADCEDEHTDTWWECPHCAGKITPGTRYVGPQRIATGHTMRLTVDNAHVPDKGPAGSYEAAVGNDRFKVTVAERTLTSRPGLSVAQLVGGRIT